MSFQFIIDNAQNIQINSQKLTAQTQSRSGKVKTRSLGVQPYEFVVTMPNGIRWSDNRTAIEAVNALGKTQTDTIQLNNPGFSYLARYQGDVGGSISLTPGAGNTFTVNDTTYSGALFQPGDFIQPVGGRVYTVTNTVTGGTVNVHRPVTESVSTSINYGTDVAWSVRCVQMPTPTVFGYDQVRWSGEFVFVEVL